MTLRRIEIGLWILGISFLSVAFGTTFDRWNYQAKEERALVQQGPAVSTSRVERASPPQSLGVSPRDDSSRARRPTAAGGTPALRLEIPRLGVKAVVKEGVDEKTLGRAVGLVPGSGRPGEIGNIVLAAHRDTFFRPLRKVKVDDRIRLTVPPHSYEYRVESVRVVTPSETSVLQSHGQEELTLVTCYPFRYVGPAPERFIVSAVRVRSEESSRRPEEARRAASTAGSDPDRVQR